MLIEITQENILNGVREDACRCPIALAFRRVFTLDADEIEVDEGEVIFFVIEPGHSLYSCNRPIKLPSEAQNFVREFDAGHVVKPISFEFNIPEKVN